MSVYSGFASQAMEANYNKSLCAMLRLCCSFISHTLRKEQFDSAAWTKSFAGHWSQLHEMDAYKDMHPKLSYYCLELAQITGATNEPASRSQGEIENSVTQLEAMILEESRLQRPKDIRRPSATPFVMSPPQMEEMFQPIPERVRTGPKLSSRLKSRPTVVNRVPPKAIFNRSTSPRRRIISRHRVMRELPEDFYAKAFIASLAV